MSAYEIQTFKKFNLKPVGVNLPILLTLEDLFILSQPQESSKPPPISPLNTEKEDDHVKVKPNVKVKRKAEGTHDQLNKKIKPSRPLKSSVPKECKKEPVERGEKKVTLKMGSHITPEKLGIKPEPVEKAPEKLVDGVESNTNWADILNKPSASVCNNKPSKPVKTKSSKTPAKILPKLPSSTTAEVTPGPPPVVSGPTSHAVASVDQQKKIDELQSLLHKVVSDNQVKENDIKDLREKVTSLDKDNRKLTTEILTKLQTKIKSLEDENSRLSAGVAEHLNSSSEMLKTIQSLREKVSEVKLSESRQVKILQLKLESLMSDKENLTSAFHFYKKKSSHKVCRRQVQELMISRLDLYEKLSEENNNVCQLEKKVQELQQHDSVHDDAREYIKSLERDKENILKRVYYLENQMKNYSKASNHLEEERREKDKSYEKNESSESLAEPEEDPDRLQHKGTMAGTPYY